MSEIVPVAPSSRWWSFIFWWVVTLFILILVDDLVFGPGFWLLAQVDPFMATAAAFAISLGFQVWVCRAALKPKPGRMAQFFINRLTAARKSPRIVEREESLRRRIASTASAIMVSLIVGGVIPIIFMHRHGVQGAIKLRRLALLTSTVYAVEFALIHGGYGLGAVVSWLI